MRSIFTIDLQDPHRFPLDRRLDQGMEGVMGSELHLEPKLPGEHVLEFDQLNKAEPDWIKIHEHIEIAVGPIVTAGARAIDIKRGRA